jgi:hypothetical protein
VGWAGWALRAAEDDCVVARLEQSSKAHAFSAKIQKAPKRDLSYFGGEGGKKLISKEIRGNPKPL